MALIKCPECGKEISDKAAACPHCGAPVTHTTPKTPPKKKGGKLKLIFIILFIAVVASFLSGDSDEKSSEGKTERATQSAQMPGQSEYKDALKKIYNEKDLTEKEAFDLMEKVAATGNIEAQAMIGAFYIFGEGTKQDLTKGYEMLKKSVADGSDFGMTQMAQLYLSGASELGIKKDPPQAIALLDKAVKNDNAFFSKMVLADCYRRGAGVSKDRERAIQLYEQARQYTKEIGLTEWATGLETTIFDLKNAPEITISPAEYQNAYESNEVAADKRFLDKTIRMTGRVNDIIKGPLGGITVYLSAGSSFMGVYCEIDSKYEDYVASLRKGQTVTIQGKGGGFAVASAVLNDCWFPGKKASPPKSRLKRLSENL